MIKFFRKIRQKLLSDNKPALPAGRFSRYFIYAIGEIVLVVIGILIALKINGWNNNIERQALAKSLLQELKNNLEVDVEDITENMGYQENSIKSSRIILDAFENDLPSHDSLHRHFGNIGFTAPFLQTVSAYHNLKDEGLRIIKNDSLRLKITDQYERNYPWLIKYTDEELQVSFRDYSGIVREKFKYSEYGPYGKMIPVDYELLKNDQEYSNYIYNRMNYISTLNKINKSYVDNINSLIKDIEKEINDD